MSIDILIALPEDAREICFDVEGDLFDYTEVDGLAPILLFLLLGVLEKNPSRIGDLAKEFEILHGNSISSVHLIPDKLTKRLSQLNSESIKTVAKRWHKDKRVQAMEVRLAPLKSALAKLCKLSKVAVEHEQPLLYRYSSQNWQK
ncbi:MAG: hypothetical protein JST89_13365 [Cyanobacteria bacterium SZAS-4]|nr:hypothetical protein [Cyanobacteria bacterium SZAS-4]